MISFSTTLVQKTFDAYPKDIKLQLLNLREIIFATAKQQQIANLEETLKWGEPSYVTTGGSTIRIGWKNSSPNHYAIYFNCKTTLVETFKEIYGDLFAYEGNRAIIFNISDTIPETQLSHCIFLSLKYHQLKKLPLLGV